MSIIDTTMTELLALLDSGVTSVEITQAYLDRIAAVDGELKGYLEVNAAALEEASRADARRRSGQRGPLLGIPIAVKDIICVRGLRNTCGSRMLEHYRPPFDATVISRLRSAGAVVIGKTNLDEFAMGSSTENSAFGPSRNPWDPSRVPGGSSGGSAVVVAAGTAPASLGTDTGGSIRQPAALCGVTGLKPTYGRVSRYGVVAYASSLDQVGPMARTAEDCARLLGVLAGVDPADSTTQPVDVPDYLAALESGCKGLRIGVPVQFLEGLDASLRARLDEAIKLLGQLGATVVEVSLPHLSHALPAYYIIAPAEASSNLARYDGARYGLRTDAPDVQAMFRATRHDGFGPEVKRRILVGTYALSAGYYDAYYLRAQQVRTLIRKDFENAFATVDALVGPATPQVAFPLGEKADDPLQMYLSDIYTIAVNLAGLPGLVVPGGFDAGLPVGLQLIGPPFEEGRLLAIGHAFQQVTDFHRQRPMVATA